MPVKRVIFPFTNDKIGGSHISSFTLGSCLQREHGVEVVVTAPADSLIARIARERDFTVWPLSEAPTVRHGLLREARLLPQHHSRLASQPVGTVVHANDLAALQSWGPAARLRGLPVVYHNRAFNRAIAPNMLVMRLAHRIICISKSVETRLPPRLARRAVLIDNPIELDLRQDTATLRRQFEQCHPIARGSILIGFVGNFAHRKRPRFFLAMARALVERCPSAVFVIFGREVDESQDGLERHAAELGIASRTIFAGFRLPVEDNISLVDLLAITAIDEPLGRTPLEALMLGVPYVATDDAGLGETGRRFGGGLLVPRDAGPDHFAQAVLDGLRAAKSGQMTAAQDQARHILDAGRHAERVMALYHGLIDRHERT
jgi:glycosyltransferase involved in cell wall biosynthesis